MNFPVEGLHARGRAHVTLKIPGKPKPEHKRRLLQKS